MRVLCPAKINLHLRVGPRRADGFHPLLSWMVTAGLFDTLIFERTRGEGIALSCDREWVPVDQGNLVLRAARLLLAQQFGRLEGIARGASGLSIRLLKRIPVGAGLGGGSSDAASTLVALNQLWHLELPIGQLERLAAELGSDVGFFLHAPSAECRGRGEQVQPIPPPAPRAAVLFFPPWGLSTPAVYRAFDELNLGDQAVVDEAPPWLQWSKCTSEHLLPLLVNDLEPAAFAVQPDLGKLRAQLEAAMGRIVRMSGSGSSLFTLYDSPEEAKSSAERVGAQFDGVAVEPVELCPNLEECSGSPQAPGRL